MGIRDRAMATDGHGLGLDEPAGDAVKFGSVDDIPDFMDDEPVDETPDARASVSPAVPAGPDGASAALPTSVEADTLFRGETQSGEKADGSDGPVGALPAQGLVLGEAVKPMGSAERSADFCWGGWPV